MTLVNIHNSFKLTYLHTITTDTKDTQIISQFIKFYFNSLMWLQILWKNLIFIFIF